MNNLIKTQEDLHQKIEDIVWEKDVSYIEAIIEYCEDGGLDVESIGDVISKNPTLMSKVAEEAQALNLLEKTDTLPI